MEEGEKETKRRNDKGKNEFASPQKNIFKKQCYLS
jgi:hypothetical protein